jgi:hypothetical protein
MGGGLTVVVNVGDARGSGGRRRAAPVIGNGKEDTDAMQKWTVNSGVWSVTTNASCSDGEWRLETGRPRSRTWASMPCRLEPEEGVRRCAKERLGGEDQSKDTGSPSHAGIDDGRHGYLQTPARNFRSPAASQTGEIEGKEREDG